MSKLSSYLCQGQERGRTVKVKYNYWWLDVADGFLLQEATYDFEGTRYRTG